jgi:hypothetical protein
MEWLSNQLAFARNIKYPHMDKHAHGDIKPENIIFPTFRRNSMRSSMEDLYALQTILRELDEFESKDTYNDNSPANNDFIWTTDGRVVFTAECKTTQQPTTPEILSLIQRSFSSPTKAEPFFEKAKRISSFLISQTHTLCHLSTSDLPSNERALIIWCLSSPLKVAAPYKPHLYQRKTQIQKQKKALRRLIHLFISLQFIAREIHNRISKSPTPFKKEPPIGGIKVGGKHSIHRHAA